MSWSIALHCFIPSFVLYYHQTPDLVFLCLIGAVTLFPFRQYLGTEFRPAHLVENDCVIFFFFFIPENVFV